MSKRTERSEAPWVRDESQALANKVLSAVLPAFCAAMKGRLPAALTEDTLRRVMLPKVAEKIRLKILEGWKPKSGWITDGAKASASPSVVSDDTVLTPEETSLAVWRVLAVEMSDEDLAQPGLNLTRAQVHATLRSKAPDVAAQIGL